ncbi:MAG: hypothetical protein ACF8GE_09085 [Phycisphaerales bacterium JB043]
MSNEPRGRLKTIRDPIHGLIPITVVEQLIIDRPEFQRLHHILQQSVAYQTYPSNRTSRFSHSVGAMHLAGHMFQSAVHSTPDWVLKQFIGDAHALVSYHVESTTRRIESSSSVITLDQFLKGFLKLVGLPISPNHRPLGRPSELVETLLDTNISVASDSQVLGNPQSLSLFKDILVLGSLWQATRVATLLHDIGHLPLSHLFESAIYRACPDAALDDPNVDIEKAKLRSTTIREARISMRDRYASELRNKSGHKPDGSVLKSTHFHEALGFLIDRHFDAWPETDSYTYRILFSLAQDILACDTSTMQNDPDKQYPGYRTLHFLHAIVSGELDADRLDYCMRDPIAAGLDSYKFDVDSIINSATIAIVTREQWSRNSSDAPDYDAIGLGPSESSSFNNVDIDQGVSADAADKSDASATEAQIDKESEQQNYKFTIAHDARSISAIEGFYFSRYHSFRQIAADHNAARFCSINEEIICRLYELYDTPLKDITDNVADKQMKELSRELVLNLKWQMYRDGWCQAGEVDNLDIEQCRAKQTEPPAPATLPMLDPSKIIRYEDGWYRSSITTLFRILNKVLSAQLNNLKRDYESSSGYEEYDHDQRESYLLSNHWPQELASLWQLLNVALNRRIDRVASLFKNEADYASFISDVVTRICSRDSEKTNSTPQRSSTEHSELKRTALGNAVSEALLRTARKTPHILENVIHDALAKKKVQAYGQEYSPICCCIVNCVRMKLPPDPASYPKVWIRHHAVSHLESQLSPLSTWSQFLNSMHDILPAASIRITILGHSLRNRSGALRDNWLDYRREIIAAISSYVERQIGFPRSHNKGAEEESLCDIDVRPQTPTSKTTPT